MSKPEQVLILDPESELIFMGPFNSVVTSYLNVRNTSERSVCFKVKSTVPKNYCSQPNKGVLLPFGSTTLAIMSKPIDIKNFNDRDRHKIMIETMFAPEGDFNEERLWREVSPELIMKSKFKCVFDMDVNGNRSSRPINAFEKQKREHLSQILSESEPSLEMDKERQSNEQVIQMPSPRQHTLSSPELTTSTSKVMPVINRSVSPREEEHCSNYGTTLAKDSSPIYSTTKPKPTVNKKKDLNSVSDLDINSDPESTLISESLLSDSFLYNENVFVNNRRNRKVSRSQSRSRPE